MPQIFSRKVNTYSRVTLFCALALPAGLIFAGSAITRSPANTNVNVPLDQPVPFSHKHHTEELGIDCRFCHPSVETSAKAGVPSTETCMACHSQIWTNAPALAPVRESYEKGTPIRWQRVNKVPEFVYFDHSIHIARGLNCNTCHGPVQQMHITWKGNYFFMRWCLECHTEPEKYLYADPAHPEMEPRQKAFELYKKNKYGQDLTPVEWRNLEGKALQFDAKQIEAGKKLVEKYGVKKKQLTDCWTCHR